MAYVPRGLITLQGLFMKKISSSARVATPLLATAFALFAMLFGTGNIVFPLGLGRSVGALALYAMIGFVLTAVLIPVIGIIAMALYDGDYTVFLQRAGKTPGIVMVIICMALLGPLCGIPRSIALSYSALQWIMPNLSLLYFSLAMAVIIFCTTIRESKVVGLMGKFLGPLKVLLLGGLIIKGFFIPAQTAPCELSNFETLKHGFFEGFGTLDLIGVIFFSSLLLASLRKFYVNVENSHREQIKMLVKSGVLGSLMLGLMYAGFIFVASFQSGAEQCIGLEKTQLLSALATIILGAGGGALASITIAVACTTTAIALTTVFVDYVHRTCMKPRGFHYVVTLLITLVIAVFFANYGFEKIQTMLEPLIMVLYPGLIVLTFTNIIYKLWKVDLGKIPFYAMLAISFINQIR